MPSPGNLPHDHCADAGTHIPRSPRTEFCDLCGERNPIEPDAEPVTGLWICVPCIEATLQGACHE